MPDALLTPSPRCPIRTTLELLGGKWRLLILFQLKEGPLRPSELRRRIPDISDKMLTVELKTLQDHELVVRTDFHEIPPRVEYGLSAKGQLALPLIGAMRDFAVAYTG
jgi:DNA-binding HxlR family transcriptional regulator